MSTRPRKTLADRLGKQLNSIPLQSVDRVPDGSFTDVKSMRRLHSIVFAAVFLPTLLIIGVPLTLYGIWWHTHSTMVCSVTDGYYEYTHGKGGPNLTFNYETSCGPLAVTSAGATLSIAETKALGSSILIGKTYQFDVYGWDGMLGIRRDIMHATSLTP